MKPIHLLFEWMNLMETVILLGLSLSLSQFHYSFHLLRLLFDSNELFKCINRRTATRKLKSMPYCSNFNMHRVTLNGTSWNVWWIFMFVYQTPSSSSLNNNFSVVWVRKKLRRLIKCWCIFFFLQNYTSIGSRSIERCGVVSSYFRYIQTAEILCSQTGSGRENIRNLIFGI